jgi:hypothetical protein
MNRTAKIVVSLVMLAGVALATVTFNRSTGTGFVGKGDVQLAFGWNNAQLQNNSRLVSFAWNANDTYAAVCEWVTGEGTRGQRTHTVTIPRHTNINAAIAYDPRVKNQITGYNLKGYGITVTDGNPPVVGEACVSDDGSGIAQNGVWISVDLVNSQGGLYANYSTRSVLIYQ